MVYPRESENLGYESFYKLAKTGTCQKLPNTARYDLKREIDRLWGDFQAFLLSAEVMPGWRGCGGKY
jgi:hypothetical protein